MNHSRLSAAAAVAVVAAVFVMLVVGCSSKKGDPGGQGVSAAVKGELTAGAGGASEIPQARSRGPEHAVFSLVDNRLAAHVQQGGGLVALPGSAGFAKYMRFAKANPSWNIRQGEAGARFGAMKTKVAGLYAPLSAEQAGGAPVLRVRARSAGAQRLGVRVNGKKDKEVTAEVPDSAGAWTVVELAVPAGAFQPGENEILFFAGKPGLEVAWVQVAGNAPAEDAPVFYDGGEKALVLPDGGGLAWYMTVPDKGLVTGDLDGAACRVAVRVTPEGGAPVEGTLVGRGSAVDLGSLSGKPVRLELTASGCPKARLPGAALVVPGEAPQLVRGPAPRNVILWIMDSLRADRIKTIVGELARADVPEFDKLATTSTVFTQTYVQGNETKCSHASIWTSLYPVNHKMIPPNSKIDPKWVTVDEVCKQSSLFTSGVSANGYITPSRGFGSKWDKYRNHIHEGGGLRAEDLLAKSFDSIADPKSPFFLYIGTIDTHVSWRAKEPWFSKYDPDPYAGRFKTEASGVDMGKVAGGSLKVNDRDIRRIFALYDSNISYQDQQIGVLFAKLEEWEVADQTMLIIVADHGDELFEDGRVGHGASVRESLVHVPLIIHYPPMFPAARVPEGVDTVDIVPTIADVLGVPPDDNWQGESLLPLANGVGRGYPRLSMASKYENGHAGRLGMWKIYVAGGGNSELYDLATEPGEMTNVAGNHPIALRMVADPLWTLRLHNAEWKKARWGNPANVSAQFASDLGE